MEEPRSPIGTTDSPPVLEVTASSAQRGEEMSCEPTGGNRLPRGRLPALLTVSQRSEAYDGIPLLPCWTNGAMLTPCWWRWEGMLIERGPRPTWSVSVYMLFTDCTMIQYLSRFKHPWGRHHAETGSFLRPSPASSESDEDVPGRSMLAGTCSVIPASDRCRARLRRGTQRQPLSPHVSRCVRESPVHTGHCAGPSFPCPCAESRGGMRERMVFGVNLGV